ncbi:hypothetical protein MN116_002055 [Schistosoma mekongi]|uniref:Asteroid domain-containing protein n=1 Tax=Schistosoma mekongi TaxID=38744 RepID=A0AAE1ZIN5_SCHME|nr:hypothetical protein MN116_002055 [Schistosoma mekongi]
MTILGLEKILLKSFASWEPIFLKDTKVVVDGNDLVGYLHDTFSTGSYGGENLLFYTVVRSFFLVLKYLNVEPYFILRGNCPINDNGLKYKQKRISALLSQMATASKLNAVDIMPLLLSLSAMDIFQDALNEFHWKCVRVKSFPTVICSAIAKILQCPVIGLSSDYFVLMSMNQNIFFNDLNPQPSFNPTYLTLRLSNINFRSVNDLSENSNTKVNTNDEGMLLFHKFIPKHSVLAKVSDFHMPLFVTLLGTDTVHSLRLPLELQEQLKASDLTPYNERRLSVLFEWFSQFQSNSIKPLEDIINCYSIEQHTSVIQDMIHSISRFICPLEETKNVISILFGKNHCNISQITHTTSELSLRFVERFQDVIDLLQGKNISYLWHEDYTRRWPLRLVDGLRNGTINPNSAIYSSHGVFLTTTVEDPECPFSIYESSFLIRRLRYQIYASLEYSLGMEDKLLGLNPDVTEYMRRNDKLVKYRIPVKTIPLDFSKVSTDEVIKDNLGFVSLPTNNLVPKFLYSLAVVLAFWFQQLKYTSIEIPSLFSESPVGLAVATCAVATIHNGDSSTNELCDFYHNLSKVATQPVISDNISTNFRPSVIHGFNAIQSTFISFKDIVTTLNCLVSENKQSDYFTFAQLWILFPSGKLVHFLATQLASLDPASRRYSTIRVWLPKLLFIKERNSSATLKLTKAMNTLINFINLCEMIRINLPSSLDSFYSIHELKSNCSMKITPVDLTLFKRNSTNRVDKSTDPQYPSRISRGYRGRNESFVRNKGLYYKPVYEDIMHSCRKELHLN